VDFENVDFEDVSGFCAVDVDGAGEDVSSGSSVVDVSVDFSVVGWNLGGWDAFLLESIGRAAGGECLHSDGLF
jgi:hypothetical protein